MGCTPHTEGTLRIRSATSAFATAFRDRVTKGLLDGRSRRRANYVVETANRDRIRFRAADWLTALNVGLNDVELRLSGGGLVRYEIRYWRWAAYVIALSAGLGLTGAILLLTLDVRGHLADEPASRLAGLSVDQGLVLIWAMVVFWGLLWPWLLIAMHKGPLRRLLARVVEEVDEVGWSNGGDTDAG